MVIYPTDSCYALGCLVGNKAGVERVRRIRGLGKDHHFTLVCKDLSEISSYARVDNRRYRLLRALTPGPYTFLLVATREVPKRLQDPRRKTIGIRVPDHVVAQELLAGVGQPLMSTTLKLRGDDLPMTDPQEIFERLGGQVAAVVGSGNGGIEPTTVIDLAGEAPVVTRAGLGPVESLQR